MQHLNDIFFVGIVSAQASVWAFQQAFPETFAKALEQEIGLELEKKIPLRRPFQKKTHHFKKFCGTDAGLLKQTCLPALQHIIRRRI